MTWQALSNSTAERTPTNPGSAADGYQQPRVPGPDTPQRPPLALTLPETDLTRWYLAFSKPKQEAVAKAQLLQQGFEAYLPLFKKLAKSQGTAAAPSTVVYEPMFARYVFFKPGRAGQSISTVRHTRGVANLVSFGFVLATVGDEVVDAIKALEQERDAAPVADISPFQPGTRVRLREKGLQALEGLVVSVSSKRVTLLLDILGRQKELSVAHSQLELS